MKSRELVTNVLNYKEVERVPRDLSAVMAISMFQMDDLNMFLKKYPLDISGPKYSYGQGLKSKGVMGKKGQYTDAWGCVWYVGEDGVSGEVRNAPLEDWSNLDSYKLPWELLNEADLSKVNESCEKSDRFIIARTETRPFERMQFLRGTENLMMGLAYGESEVIKLRDMLHEFFVREMEMWASTDVDGVYFMDDWGSQSSLLISPLLWRELFKPLYKEYCDILHKKGKYVFFHSDGFIEEIYPDLIEVGVNAINSQLFCMNMEKLGEKYSGKIVFWGEVDRQHVLPFGSQEEIKAAVQRIYNSIMRGKNTGYINRCSWSKGDPVENIMTAYGEWDNIVF